MIDLAMQLGLSPVPAKTTTGTMHTADGQPPKVIHKRGDRAEAIKERRTAILEICKEPVTFRQIKEALSIKEGTLAADLRAMVNDNTLRMVKEDDGVHWEAK